MVRKRQEILRITMLVIMLMSLQEISFAKPCHWRSKPLVNQYVMLGHSTVALAWPFPKSASKCVVFFITCSKTFSPI
jgi:hypothetical protein